MLPQERELNPRSLGVAAASVAGVFFGPGPMLVAGIGPLLTSVSHDLGWSRTLYAAVPLIAAWAAAFSTPFFGRLMDRYGIRPVMLPTTFLFGLSFLGVALLSHATWQFFAAYLVIGLFAGAQGPVGYNKAIAQWFDRNRGLTIALVAAIGSGLGYATMPFVYNYMITHYGWRSGYLVVTAGIVLISFTLSFLFLRERVRVLGHVAEGPAQALEGVDRGEGVRSAAFWQLAVTLFLACNAFYGVMVHLFPLLLDAGVSRAAAAGALSVVALGAIAGQVSAAILLDRVNTPKVAILFFLAGLAGILLIQFAGGGKLIFPGAVLLGFGQGAELSVIAYLTTRILGLRSFGSLYGLIYAGANAAAGTGPLLMGISFDRTGSYATVLMVLEAFLVVGIVLIALLPPYRFGKRPPRPVAAVAV